MACACAFSLLSWVCGGVCGQEGSTKTSWWFIVGKAQLTPSLPPNYFRRGNQSLPTETLNNGRQTNAVPKCSTAMPRSNTPLSWLPYGSSARKTKASLIFLFFLLVASLWLRRSCVDCEYWNNQLAYNEGEGGEGKGKRKKVLAFCWWLEKGLARDPKPGK